MKKIIVTFIVSLLFVNIYAQTSAVNFIIHKNNNKIVAVNENGEKTIIFDAIGLSSKQDVDTLLAKVANKRGVISATTSDAPENGKWRITVVFYKYADQKYFPQFFKWCGVQTVEIDNIKFDTQNINYFE